MISDRATVIKTRFEFENSIILLSETKQEVIGKT